MGGTRLGGLGDTAPGAILADRERVRPRVTPLAPNMWYFRYQGSNWLKFVFLVDFFNEGFGQIVAVLLIFVSLRLFCRVMQIWAIIHLAA